nr:MAG TPA: hypothetical protein [Caudoviricetes sp.]
MHRGKMTPVHFLFRRDFPSGPCGTRASAKIRMMITSCLPVRQC